ncbi:MAG: FkbM family methyltransferase [Thermodesulfobacteriota bacterium]
MKRAFVRLIGEENYVKSFGYISDLYQSVFLRIKEEGTSLVPNFIRQGDTVFDIGANVGRFTSFAAKLVGKNGRVYSFEPQSYPRKVLSQMKSIRGFFQVTVVDTALSDQVGKAAITIPLKDGWKPKSACGHLDGTGEGAFRTETVDLTTLDLFCESHAVERLDFIKCDVEGAELKLFSSGLRALKRFSPVLYTEVDKLCLDRRGISLRAIFDFMEGIGYKAYLPDETKRLYYVSPDNITREKTEYFFIPKVRAARINPGIFRDGEMRHLKD